MAIFVTRTQTVNGIQYLANRVYQDSVIGAAVRQALMQGGGALDAGPDSSGLSAAQAAVLAALYSQPALSPLEQRAVLATFNTGTIGTTIAGGPGFQPWNSGVFTFPAGDMRVGGTVYPDSNVAFYQNVTQPNQVFSSAIEFHYSGGAFEVVVYKKSAAQIRVIADNSKIVHAGRSVAIGGSAGDILNIKFDLGTIDADLRVELLGASFYGLQYAAGAVVTPIDLSGDPLVIGLGDSFEAGVGTGFGWDANGCQMARLMGWRRYWPSGVGGTGYSAKPDITFRTFAERLVSDAIAYSPKLIHIAGSTNDAGVTDSALTAVAAPMFAQVRSAGIELAVTGVYSVQNADAGQLARNAVLKQLCLAAGGRFIDPLTDPTPWIYGTGKVDSTVGDGNADYATASDRGHPTFTGHALIGRRRAQACRGFALGADGSR